MGALNDGHFNVEDESFLPIGFENEQTLAIESAVKVLLDGLGEDVNREGLKKTPYRVAKALQEGMEGYKQKVRDIVQDALFPEAGLDEDGCGGGEGGLVIVRDSDFFSYCESCLLPFQVKCHIGYISSEQRVLGLSKLSRVAEVFGKRLQDPHRLAGEICSALHHEIKPAGVAVILQCYHIHFPDLESLFLDSNNKGSAKAFFRSGSGVFENENDDAWFEFLGYLRFKGINADKTNFKNCKEQCWCPFRTSSSSKISSKFGPPNPRMVAAVASILRSLGEDPSRKELVGTPSCFVKWLMNFQNPKLEMKLNTFVCGRNNSLKPIEEITRVKEQMHSEVNLSVWSLCEHHLLPFYGVVHVAYICAEEFNPIGKSLLQSIVHFHGFRLQVQERLTTQIAKTVSSLLSGDVMVVSEAHHTCMTCRGIKKIGSSSVSVAKLGRFSTDTGARNKFLQTILSTTTTSAGL